MEPQVRTLVISFLVIGQSWVAHHRVLSFVRRYDARFLYLNLVYLLFVTLVPFPTAVLGRYDEMPIAVVLYAGTLATSFGLLALLWHHATRGHRLVDPDLDPADIRLGTMRSLVPVVVFLGSIPLAYVNTMLAELSWVLIYFGMVALRGDT